MINKNNLARLTRLQAEANRLRERLGLSGPNEVIYLADLDVGSDERVVAEPDGVGGAVVRVVEGNWPLDFIEKHVGRFGSEEVACETAQRIAEGHVSAEIALV